MSSSWKKLLNVSAKLLIGLLLAWALYEQVIARENIHDLWDSILLRFKFPTLFWLVATILLAPINLVFETLKFRQLIHGFTAISWWRTFCAVLAGITIAIFTPNRVGEPGGRVLFVEPEQGWKAVIATLVGSLSQLLALLSAGLLGAVYFSSRFLSPRPYVLALVACLGLSLVAVLFFGYFNIDLFVPFAKRIPFIHKFKKHLRHLSVLRNYTRRELGRTYGYSFLRYLIYSTQYYLLLRFFGISVGWPDGMACIATIFLVQATVPLPPVAGLLARGEIALVAWGFFSEDKAAILAATFTLFVINIVLPALLGLVCIVQVNFLKFFGYESKGLK